MPPRRTSAKPRGVGSRPATAHTRPGTPRRCAADGPGRSSPRLRGRLASPLEFAIASSNRFNELAGLPGSRNAAHAVAFFVECDEPADYKSFRLGLFGLDKLHDADRTVAYLEEALDTVL